MNEATIASILIPVTGLLAMAIQWAKGQKGGGRVVQFIAHGLGALAGLSVWWLANGDSTASLAASTGLGALLPVGWHSAIRGLFPALSEALKALGRAQAPKPQA